MVRFIFYTIFFMFVLLFLDLEIRHQFGISIILGFFAGILNEININLKSTEWQITTQNQTQAKNVQSEN